MADEQHPEGNPKGQVNRFDVPPDLDGECERLGQMLLAAGWCFMDAFNALTLYHAERRLGISPGNSFMELSRRFDGPGRVNLTTAERLVIIRSHVDALHDSEQFAASLKTVRPEPGGE